MAIAWRPKYEGDEVALGVSLAVALHAIPLAIVILHSMGIFKSAPQEEEAPGGLAQQTYGDFPSSNTRAGTESHEMAHAFSPRLNFSPPMIEIELARFHETRPRGRNVGN